MEQRAAEGDHVVDELAKLLAADAITRVSGVPRLSNGSVEVMFLADRLAPPDQWQPRKWFPRSGPKSEYPMYGRLVD